MKIPRVCSSACQRLFQQRILCWREEWAGEKCSLEASFPSRWIIYLQYLNSRSPFYRNTKLGEVKGWFPFLLILVFCSQLDQHCWWWQQSWKRSQGQRSRSWQNWATCSPSTLFALVKWLLLQWRLSLVCKVCAWHRNGVCLLSVHICLCNNTAHLEQDG